MFTRIKYDTFDGWLQLRKKGLGGSDCSCIVGANPYKSNLTLYKEKKGLIIPEDISDKKQVIYGKKAEEHIRALFALKYADIYEVKHTNELLVSNHYDFIRGSLDGEIVEIKTGKKGVLEIKTTFVLSSMANESWKYGIPQNYYCQLLHYMFITKFDFVIIVYELIYEIDGIFSSSIKSRRFERSDMLEDMKYLISKEIFWWENYFLKDVEPPLELFLNSTNA